jgi:hypothetical protein
MFRFKIYEKDVNAVKKFLKSKKGAMPKWGERFRDDLKLEGNRLLYKNKRVVPIEKIDTILRKTLYSKKANLTTSRDSAFHQLKKIVVGISRRNIMEFLRSQKNLEARATLPAPKQTGGRKLKRITFETDLCFIRKADLVKANPRFEDKHGHDLVYCVTTVEKTSGLCRLGYSLYKDQKLVTPIVIEQIKSLCETLGVSPSNVDLESDKGTEFGQEALAKVVKEYRRVPMSGSVEKKNQQLQKYLYQILKNRQALTVPTALKKAENLCNKTYGTVHKKTPEEVAVLVKSKKLDAVKGYNDKRRTQISNSKRKELQIGDHVRILIASAKVKGVGFKQYKNKSFTKELYTITDRTQKKKLTGKPIKYRVEGLSYKKGQPFQGKWYTVDKLLKSAIRDEKSKELIKKRDEEQIAVDAKDEKKENERVAREIKQNQERLLKLRDEGVVAVPSVNRGIANLKNIKNMQKKDAKIKGYINELQQEYEAEVKAKGQKISEEEPRALKWIAAKQRDEEYDPIENIADLDDEDDSPKRKRRVRKRKKPKPSKVDDDESTDEEKSAEPKKSKKRPSKKKKPRLLKMLESHNRLPGESKKPRKKLVQKVDSVERRRLINAFKAKAKELLQLQRKGFEGKDFEAKILKFNDVMKAGRALGVEIKNKKYKHKLNINFFNQ